MLLSRLNSSPKHPSPRILATKGSWRCPEGLGRSLKSHCSTKTSWQRALPLFLLVFLKYQNVGDQIPSSCNEVSLQWSLIATFSGSYLFAQSNTLLWRMTELWEINVKSLLLLSVWYYAAWWLEVQSKEAAEARTKWNTDAKGEKQELGSVQGSSGCAVNWNMMGVHLLPCTSGRVAPQRA